MNSYSKIMLYLPLFSMLLFIVVALVLQSSMEEFVFEGNPNEFLLVAVFAAFSLADMMLVVPRMAMPKVLNAANREEAMKHALMPLTMTTTPMLFGFILFFLYGSWLYFGAFIVLGLVSWLYFYRQIENKLNSVQ